MKAAVTGISGFVGVHLADHLVEMGDEITGVDRHESATSTAVDIRDPLATREYFCQTRPEVVYHLAGAADVGGSWADPAGTFRANAEGTLNVLSACVEAGVSRVVCVSSADIYGRVTEEELPLDETAPLRPVSPYAASKVAADYLGLQSWLGHGLAVIRARPFNHLGPGQRPKFVAPAIADRIARNELEGRNEVAVGNLSPRRDFTDVRDVARAYRLLMLHGAPGEAYNICSGVDIPIRELATRLVGMALKPMSLVTDRALERPVDIPALRGDNTKLRDATGWAPEIPLDVTLADLLDDARARNVGPEPPRGSSVGAAGAADRGDAQIHRLETENEQ